jgi:hypothetical protein
MRVTAGFLSVLCMGVLSQALAADPTPPAASQTPTAPSATAPAAQPGAAKPAADSTAAASAATPDAGKAELTAADHELMSQGYKLEMRHGEKYFCRRETIMGSHFEQKSCNTATSIESRQAAAQETVRKIQLSNTPRINN